MAKLLMFPDLLFRVSDIPDVLVGYLCLHFPYCLSGYMERLKEAHKRFGFCQLILKVK